MDIDSALDKVGGYRRWHLTAFTLVGFSLFVPICFHGLIIIFAGWQPNHHCQLAGNQLINESIPLEKDAKGGDTFSKCHIYVNSSSGNFSSEIGECSDWEYLNEGYFTIIEQWDLVCEHNYLSELSQSLYMIGYLTSTLGLSFLVDKFGRKMIHICSHAFIGVIGIAIAFSNNFIMFVVLRILLGMVIVINCNSGITYLTELFDSKRRAFAGICLEFPWVGCYLLLSLGAYYISDWRTLQIVISCTSLLFLPLYWIIPESPLWLVAVDRHSEAEIVLRKMAKWNGVKLDPNVKLLKWTAAPSIKENIADLITDTRIHASTNNVNFVSENYILEKDKNGLDAAHSTSTVAKSNKENDQITFSSKASLSKDGSPSVWILFKDRYLRKVVIICNLFWFGNCVLYYGLTLSTPSLAGNRYINFLIMGLVEIPAIFAAWYTTDRYGRRLSTSVYHLLAGIPLAVVVFVPETTSSGASLAPLIITLTMISKFCITASFSVIILYTKELFPTNLRGAGSGICQILGNIGTLFSPFAMYLTKTSLYWAPNMFFGVVSVGVGLATLMLPETANRPLPQTVEDLHMLFKSTNSGWRKEDNNNSELDKPHKDKLIENGNS